MAQRIDLTYDGKATKRAVDKMHAAFKGNGKNAPVAKAAQIWQGRMKRRTPKRWSGTLQRSWIVQQVAPNVFELTSNMPVIMKYLEMGTKAHGPTKAKRLFVPLTRKAAQAGPKGVMQAIMSWRANRQPGSKTKPPYIVGRDFVWAKRVKGIKARWFIRSARAEARTTLKILMRDYITNIIR